MTTVIARTVVRVVVPIILVSAVAIFMQGHNRPGGGFIAGVLTATAFALIYIVFGMEYLQDTLLNRRGDASFDRTPGIVGDYRFILASGLALAVVSGLVPMVFDLPFMTQTAMIVEHLPLFHEMELASALAFDTGVYLTVVGALLAVLAVVGAE